jgi:hypothetical protein
MSVAKQWRVPLTPEILGVVTLQRTHLNEPDTEGKYALNNYLVDMVPDDPAVFQSFRDWALTVASQQGEDTSRRTPLGEYQVPGTVPSWSKRVPSITLKSKRKPELIDAQRNPMPAHVRIGNGSKAKVAGWLTNYDNGVYLILEVVQILDLAEDTASRTGKRRLDLTAFRVEEGYRVKE